MERALHISMGHFFNTLTDVKAFFERGSLGFNTLTFLYVNYNGRRPLHIVPEQSVQKMQNSLQKIW